MTTMQFVEILVLATYFTGVIGIIKDLLEEKKAPHRAFIVILFDAMPKSKKVLFYVALFTIGPFMWFHHRIYTKA